MPAATTTKHDVSAALTATMRNIPSHDTLCDVFAALDPVLFKACFQTWVSGLRDADADIIAIDGKTSRRSHDRRKGAATTLASCVSLGGTSADRARPAGDRGEIQRDHRDFSVAEAPRSKRRSGHYGCDRDEDLHRPRDPRRRRRLLHVTEEELAHRVCRCRAVVRRSAR